MYVTLLVHMIKISVFHEAALLGSRWLANEYHPQLCIHNKSFPCKVPDLWLDRGIILRQAGQG